MNVNANPQRLILAREIRGFTQTHLAQVTGIDQGTISKYEGELLPILAQHVEAIAASLKFPVEFFYRPGQRGGVESGEIFHRKRSALPSKQLKTIHAQLNVFRLNIEKLLEVADVDARLKIPRYNIYEFDGDIETIAQMVRAAWKIPPGPIPSLMKVLEDAFCIIHACDFGTNQIDETVQWHEPMPPIILVNSRTPGERLRFTLAHSLGHLVLHHDSAPYVEMESEADRFAAAFLMPAKDIAPELDPVTLEHLIQLKPAWKVSVQALIHRARDIGKIEDRRYASLFQMLSRAGYRRNEPLPLPAEEPTLFGRLLSLYKDELGYSYKDIARLLAISEDDFWHWYVPEKWRPRLLTSTEDKSDNMTRSSLS